MNSHQIIQIIRDSANLLNQDFDGLVLSEIDSSPRTYGREDLSEFNRDLIEAANKQRIIYLENRSESDGFANFLEGVEIPIIAYEDTGNELIPLIIYKEKRKLFVLRLDDDSTESFDFEAEYCERMYREDGNILFMGVFSYQSLVSDDPEEGDTIKKFTRYLWGLSV